MGERLAGIAACDYVNGLHAGEVQLGYVAVVGDAGEVVVKDAAGRLVVLNVPSDLAAQDLLDRQVKAAVAGKQGADAHATMVAPLSDVRRVVVNCWVTAIRKPPRLSGAFDALSASGRNCVGVT